MTIEELATRVIKACESEGVHHMVTGAFAYNFYGIPRSTNDVDLVIDVSGATPIDQIIARLEPEIRFAAQVQFDTLTWGRRHVGYPNGQTALQVELFELFDDSFVQNQFQRRRRLSLPLLGIDTWLPTAEDIVVQKIRWGRAKDLEDARDILAVQGIETLDMEYVETWCAEHKTGGRLEEIMHSLREF